MRTAASRVAFLLAVSLSPVARAEVVNGPGNLFSLTLPGAWTVDDQRPGAAAWSGVGLDGGKLTVIAAVAELDPNLPFAPQMIQEAQRSEEFPNARDFAQATVPVLGQASPLVRFTWDSPEGRPMVTCSVAFTVGQCVYVLLVIGPPSPATVSTADQIARSIAAPAQTPRAPGVAQSQVHLLGTLPTPDGASAQGLPEGWLWKQSSDGMAVQVFEKAQPGAVAELCVMPSQARSAAALLREVFCDPHAHRLDVKGVSRSQDDTLALFRYMTAVSGTQLRGEVLVELEQGMALIAHVAAQPDRFSDVGVKARQLLVGLAAGSEGGGSAPQTAQVALHPALNVDRTATISVPAGWTVAGLKGMVEATDGAGLHVVVGLNSPMSDHTVAARLAAGGLNPYLGGATYLDYLPPDQAFPAVLSCVAATAGIRITDMQMVMARRLPADPNFAVFEAKWREHPKDGRVLDRHGVGMIMTQPPLDGIWCYYLSLASAPAGKLEASLPLLLSIYKSASWTPSYRSDVIAGIQSDLAEISEIVAGVARRRSESSDTASRMWGAVIRGDEGIINPTTGERRLIRDLDDVRRWMADDPSLRLDDLRRMTFDEWRTAGF